MLDYKDIIIKHYALHMSGRQIAAAIGASKSGVNDFLKAFEQCESLSYPLPAGITNYGIAELVYGRNPEGVNGRDLSFELPDFAEVEKQMSSRKNMTLVFLWGRYKNRCMAEEKKFYSYRQFCDRYMSWREANYETLHFNAVIGEKMEVGLCRENILYDQPSDQRTQYDRRICGSASLFSVHLRRRDALYQGTSMD